MLKTFFTFMLNAIPMGGLRTYIMGTIGLLLAVVLLYMGDWELGGTLLVLSLQVVFLRASAENLTNIIATGLEAILASKATTSNAPNVPLPSPLPEPDLPAEKYPGREDNDRKAVIQ